jgi:hypothetical protein
MEADCAGVDMSSIPILFGVRGSDHVLIELKPRAVSGWFQAEIFVRCGPWSGHCAGRFLAGELHKFGQGVNEIYANLRCTALLRPMEPYLVMNLNADGHGHVQVSGLARHELESKLKLEFDFVMDQEDLEPIGRALLAADHVHV